MINNQEKMLHKYYCSFKDGRPQPNLSIEAVEFENYFHVEIWDVTTDYDSMNMFEDEKKSLIKEKELEILEQKAKLCGKKDKDALYKERIAELKSSIGHVNKHKNKRYKYSKEDFHNTFHVGLKIEFRTFYELSEYEKMYPYALKSMDNKQKMDYFDRRLKGEQYSFRIKMNGYESPIDPELWNLNLEQ